VRKRAEPSRPRLQEAARSGEEYASFSLPKSRRELSQLRITPIYCNCIKTLLSSSWPSRAQKSTSASSLRLSFPAFSYTNLGQDGAESTNIPRSAVDRPIPGFPDYYWYPNMVPRHSLLGRVYPELGQCHRGVFHSVVLYIYIYIKRYDKKMDQRSLSFSFPTSIYHHLHSHNFHYQPIAR
jgi:hypothetical protein